MPRPPRTASAWTRPAPPGTRTWETGTACDCEGGEVLDTVSFDRGAFACILSRAGDPRLFVVGQNYGDADPEDGATGRLAAFSAPAPGAGFP